MYKNSKILIPLLGTFRPKGGMTSSVLKKASDLAEDGFDVTIATFSYRFDQDLHERSLINEGLISSRVKFVNFYSSLESQVDRARLFVPQYQLQPKSKLLAQRENERLTRYFEPDGTLAFTELASPDDGSKHLWRRYYDENLELLRLEEISPSGKLQRIKRFVPTEKSARSESLISLSGTAFLTTWFNRDGSEKMVVDLSNPADEINRSYPTSREMKKSWFLKLVSTLNNPVLLLDDTSVFEYVEHSLNDTRRNILTLHSNVFRDPSSINSGINDEHKNIFSRLNQFSKLVVSTKAQKADLQTIGIENSIIAIPQSVDLSRSKFPSDNLTRSRTKVVYVGRLEPSKQLLEFLNEFPSVISAHPNVELEIYGEGSLRQPLEDLIQELSMESNVRLCGVTSNPIDVFSSAHISILPTRFEGFGLVIAESMSAGTPVIAFDCNYGPSEMISDSVNGHLVEPQNFLEFNKRIDNALTEYSHIDSMRNKCYVSISDLCSRNNVARKWNDLLSASLSETSNVSF